MVLLVVFLLSDERTAVPAYFAAHPSLGTAIILTGSSTAFLYNVVAGSGGRDGRQSRRGSSGGGSPFRQSSASPRGEPFLDAHPSNVLLPSGELWSEASSSSLQSAVLNADLPHEECGPLV